MLEKFLLVLWQIILQLAPYLLIGFLVAGLLHSFFTTSFIIKHLGTSGIKGILKAALLGIPMPLCSCSVIPVATALRKSGASSAATTAFLIATPQTGIDNILVVYSFLGLPFALMSPIFTFFSAIVGGVLISMFGNNKSIETSSKNCSDVLEEERKIRNDTFWHKIKKSLNYGFNIMPADITNSLLFGIFLTAVIQVIIPDNFFENITKNIFLQKLLMVVASIPVYVCSASSAPIAAALIAKGVSPGSALVFLMAGPASNIATITTMSKALGWRNIWIYLIAIILSAIFFGTIVDIVFIKFSIPIKNTILEHIHLDSGSPITYVMAVALVILLGYHLCHPFLDNCLIVWHKLIKSSHKFYKIEIEGIQCQECFQKIKGVLLKLDNVRIEMADYQKGFILISAKKIDESIVKQLIEEAGYSVKKISEE